MVMDTAGEHAPVVVVGAGQAGLSVAWHLVRAGLRPGVDLVVLDRAPDTGGAWQFRWEALRLGDAHRVHDLPGMSELGLRFDDADRTRPAREVVTDYYRAYEEHLDLQVRRPVAVTAVQRTGATATDATATGADGTSATGASDASDGGRLALTTRVVVAGESGPPGTDGDPRTITTQALVSATGTWGTPFVPTYPGREVFRGRQLDTTGYRSAAEFAGQDVVVVGGGTSAIGFLLELEGVARSTRWFTRRPVVWSRTSGLGVEAAVAAVAEQDRAARAGAALPSIVSGTGIPVSPRIRRGLDRGVLRDEPVFVRLDEDGVVTADGEHVHADAVIWATGFRADLRHLAPLHLRTAAGGIAVEDGRAVDEPRLFLAGYGPQASTIGANRAGRRTARQVLALLAADTSAGRS